MNSIGIFLDLKRNHLDFLTKRISHAKLELFGLDPDYCKLTKFHHCNIILGNPPVKWVAKSKNIKWIQLESVGFGEYQDIALTIAQKNISMTNLAGFFSEPVAESILAGILACLRKINELVVLQKSHKWDSENIRSKLRVLKNSRVLLVGYGSINKRLHELLMPFDCKIIILRKDTPLEIMDDALATTDIVISTAPDTEQTKQLFCKKRINQLPSHAIFANFGRGSVLDEKSLIEALQNSNLGGAVIDVTEAEPLSHRHPLWDCPNTILTQHSAGGTGDEIEKKLSFFIDNLGRFNANEPLKSCVDFERGY